jgi:hypothetical protein
MSSAGIAESNLQLALDQGASRHCGFTGRSYDTILPESGLLEPRSTVMPPLPAQAKHR